MPKTIRNAYLLLLILLVISPVSAQTTIKFSCASEPHQRDYKFALQQYTAAFAKLGINFEMEHVPKNRISAKMFEQRFDGDCGRIPTFTKENNIQNTFTIEAPLRTAIFTIWRLKSDRAVRANSELRVQVISQVLSIDSYLKLMDFQVVPERDSFDSLVKKLRQGSIDRILVYQAALNNNRHHEHYPDVTPDREIIALPVKGLMHNRHAAMAKNLAQALETIRENNDPTTKPSEAPSPLPTSKPHITFSCTVPRSRKEYTQAKQMFSHAFDAIGYTYVQKDVNFEEETNLLKRGLVDGSCGRSVSNYVNTRYTTMDSPTARATLKLWSHKAKPSINSLSDLPASRSIVIAGKPLHMMRLLEPFQGRVTEVKTPTQAFRFVISRRADYYLSFSTAPTTLLHTMKITEPLFWAGNIDYGYIYPLLLKKHQHIEEPLNETLTKQKKNYPTLIEHWEARSIYSATP